MALPSITVSQLEYLVAAADAASMADAAEACGVSASALSQGLSELERRIGFELFERVGRRRTVRAEAAEVVVYARRVLADTAGIVRHIGEIATGRSGLLRVGMIDAAAVHHFPAELRAFREASAEVDLHLVVAPSGALLDQLRNGQLDVVVCVAPRLLPTDIHVEELLDEPLLVLAPPDVKVEVSPAKWGPWVTYPPGSHTRSVIARELTRLGAGFEVVAESNQPEVLAEMVRLGLGWAVLPASQTGDLRRARPEPIGVRHLVVATSSRRDLGPLAADLITRLRR